jgi:purine nucleosidase
VRILAVFFAVLAIASAQPEPIIVDTDSAIFNDDGAALAMVLADPDKATVLGITLVPGNLWPSEGAFYMFRVIDAMHQPSIPLHFGARAPLVHTREMAQRETHDWGPIDYLGAFGQEKRRAPRLAQKRHRLSH